MCVSRLFLDAMVTAVRTATGEDLVGKLVQDNPASMFQIVDELLKGHNRPIFVLVERADLLFRKLPEVALFVAQHYKHLAPGRLCVLFESRVDVHAANFPSAAATPIILNIPEYTKAEVENILMKEKPAQVSPTLFHNYLQAVVGYFYLSTHDLRLLKHVLGAHLKAYCQPVIDGHVSESSVVLLWRKIEPVFRVARASLFLKSGTDDNQTTLGNLQWLKEFRIV